MSIEVIAVLGFLFACVGLTFVYVAIEKLFSFRIGGRHFETPDDVLKERYLPPVGGDGSPPHTGA